MKGKLLKSMQILILWNKWTSETMKYGALGTQENVQSVTQEVQFWIIITNLR